MRTVDRGSGERSTPRRMISILATLGLVTGMLAIAAPGAGAVVNDCRARNVSQGTPDRSNLQAAIAAAHWGDTIAVRGVCVGNFMIGKNLTLVGRESPQMPKAVLDADGSGRVLIVAGTRVTLTNFEVTGGKTSSITGFHSEGGGIANRGSLTMNDSVVRGNRATGEGGGIANNGTLIMNDSVVRGNVAHNPESARYGGGIANRGSLTMNDSVVRGNRAIGAGGIFNDGTLTMNGSSSVARNASRSLGGGIRNLGTLTMNGSSSVARNRSGNYGGGIYNGDTVILSDSSSVTGNTASLGGGIFNRKVGVVNACNSTGLHEWVGAISPNTPDDPPKVTLITCT